MEKKIMKKKDLLKLSYKCTDLATKERALMTDAGLAGPAVHSQLLVVLITPATHHGYYTDGRHLVKLNNGLEN